MWREVAFFIKGKIQISGPYHILSILPSVHTPSLHITYISATPNSPQVGQMVTALIKYCLLHKTPFQLYLQT